MPFGDGLWRLRRQRAIFGQKPPSGDGLRAPLRGSLGETGVFGEIFREILGKFLYAAPRKNFRAARAKFGRASRPFSRENRAKIFRRARKFSRDFRVGRGENFSRGRRVRVRATAKNPGAATAFAREARENFTD